MDYCGFDWSEGNEEKLWRRHQITPEEVEEAVENEENPPLPIAVYNQLRGPRIEKRHGIVGETTGGRLLAIVYTMRGCRIRALSARDATPAEKRRLRQ